MRAATDKSRIAFLDGLRGIAILLVVLFHAYAGWTELVPYGDQYASFPLFAYGRLGVQLFFIISGFVIFMTLEKCHDYREFIVRRWLRLFPAMLVCSAIIFLTAPFFPERPDGASISYLDLLPGLTFIEPRVLSMLLGVPMWSIEGSFWSIYVEVQFYIIFGALYFLLGWRRAVAWLTGLFCLAAAVLTASKTALFGDIKPIVDLIYFTGAHHYGWFAAGALYYKYFREENPVMLLAAAGIAFIAALTIGAFDWTPKFYALLLVLVFTFSIRNARMQALLTHPGLLFVGFISYPLYLLHESMMVAMIVKIGNQMPYLYGLLMPVLPISAIIVVSWFIAARVEPRTRNELAKLGSRKL